MKNLTFLLLTVCFFCQVNPSFATEPGNPPNANSTNSSISEVYERIIAYPPNIRFAHQTEIVLVAFTIEPCGNITIHESNSSNPDFLEYVTRKLQASAMIFVNSGKNTHYLKFTFVSR